MRLSFSQIVCLFPIPHPLPVPLVSISEAGFSLKISQHTRSTLQNKIKTTFHQAIIIIGFQFILILIIIVPITTMLPRFLSVLICLIFSVLSTIQDYAGFADQTLFWMVTKHYYAQHVPKTQFTLNPIDRLHPGNLPGGLLWHGILGQALGCWVQVDTLLNLNIENINQGST